jgi:4a-hydroxytetrahydrobiopterin dehydratase
VKQYFIHPLLGFMLLHEAESKIYEKKDLYKKAMSESKLSLSEIEAGLSDLDGWSIQGEKLSKEFKFTDFVHAFGFMSSMAVFSQSIDHHPEWFNVYNKVTVNLVTHDANGITKKDMRWAHKANEVAKL